MGEETRFPVSQPADASRGRLAETDCRLLPHDCSSRIFPEIRRRAFTEAGGGAAAVMGGLAWPRSARDHLSECVVLDVDQKVAHEAGRRRARQ